MKFSCPVCATEYRTFKEAANCVQTHWTPKDDEAMARYRWLWYESA
jgi:hypothetical protein